MSFISPETLGTKALKALVIMGRKQIWTVEIYMAR